MTRSARLYDLETAKIMTASFRDSGTGSGAVAMTREDNSACKGEFRTIAGGSTDWGTVFYSSGRTATGVTTATANDQRGSAVVTCSDGVIIECEYVTSAWSGGGHGACQDNRTRRYRLMF